MTREQLEVAGDGAVVLGAEGLKIAADDGRGEAEVPQRDRKSLALELPRGHRYVSGAVRAVAKRLAFDARAVSGRVTGADGCVNDRGSSRRRTARRRWTFVTRSAPSRGGPKQ